jgi:hypothetical protein
MNEIDAMEYFDKVLSLITEQRNENESDHYEEMERKEEKKAEEDEG